MKRIRYLLTTVMIGVGPGCGDSELAEPSSVEKHRTVTGPEHLPSDANVAVPGDNREKRPPCCPTVSLPEDLPPDVPILPGARPVHVGHDKSLSAIQLETTKSVEEVITFYAMELERRGWSIFHTTSALVHAKKPDKRIVQVMAAKPKNGPVGVSVFYR